MLKLYNSFSRKIEDFQPINASHVGMYTCGPTVYDFMHIGNLRTFTFSDILHRTLKSNGYEVKLVENITDIDDKIISRAKERRITTAELVDEYTKYFQEDILKLNMLSVSVQPKATEHIGKMIKFIEELIKKGYAYVTEDGSVYFDISKFSDYGKLSQLDKRSIQTGTRILSDEYTKDNVQDFALWKSEEKTEVGWDSPWGWGRPGWHIECSVMSQEYLGDTFDIHAGGIDLLFPHHENEIAQSEGRTGKKFVNYFVHGEHILVDGEKMSKSLNNFFTLKDLEEKGFDPLALKYLFLTAHYRDKLNFTWKSLEAAQNTLNNLREIIRDWDEPKIGCSDFETRFMESINNDLNAPQALAILWGMIRSDYPTSAKAKTILEMDEVLGLKLEDYLGKKIEVPEEVMHLVRKREQARNTGDFKGADKLRKQVKKMGYQIEDTPSGPKVKSVVN
ncbi:MAG: cysteine--tRNA ligase [Patescibacteria group bacterium]